MAELNCTTLTQGSAHLLSPRGWMDISNVAALLDAVRKWLATETGPLGIDFSATEYIDSAAVSTLIQAKSLAEDAGTWLGLVALSPQVERVLRETRLIDIFPVFPDSDAFFAEAENPTPKD